MKALGVCLLLLCATAAALDVYCWSDGKDRYSWPTYVAWGAAGVAVAAVVWQVIV